VHQQGTAGSIQTLNDLIKRKRRFS
jgi:polo-like kinase 1